MRDHAFHQDMLHLLLVAILAHPLSFLFSFQLPKFSSQSEMLNCVKMRPPLDFVDGSD